VAQKSAQMLLRGFVSKLSTKKYNRRSRLLRLRPLLQRAMSVPECFSVDKEETTI